MVGTARCAVRKRRCEIARRTPNAAARRPYQSERDVAFPTSGLDNEVIHADTAPFSFVFTVMNDNSHPAGKISVHGDGFGAPSPDAIEKRAREIALIAERDPDEFTDADWDQARRELLGSQAPNAPEETADNAEVVEEWNVVASSAGHRAP